MNVTSLAELVVEEVAMGTVIHCTGETDVFGFASCLSTQLFKVRYIRTG